MYSPFLHYSYNSAEPVTYIELQFTQFFIAYFFLFHKFLYCINFQSGYIWRICSKACGDLLLSNVYFCMNRPPWLLSA